MISPQMMPEDEGLETGECPQDVRELIHDALMLPGESEPGAYQADAAELWLLGRLDDLDGPIDDLLAEQGS